MTVPEPSRTAYLGGSDAASVLGVSHWKSRYALWCEKSGAEVAKDLSDIDYIYFGTLLEPIVARVFSERTKLKVRVASRFFTHSKYPFLGGHIDRDVLGENAFLECKTANAFDYRDWGKSEMGIDGVPEHYRPQLDHYMMVRDCSHCYMAALIGGNEFRWYKVMRDTKREARLLQAELNFWVLVETDTPPDVSSEKDSRHRWKALMEGTSVVVDSAARGKIVRLSKVATAISVLEKEEKGLRNWLFPLFQDKEFVADAQGEALARLSVYPRTQFELDEFRKKNKRLAKKFTSAIPTKRLKVLI